MADSSYGKPGQIFSIGSEAANAAKSGAAKARQLIDVAEPGVTEMNAKLSKLHDIENNINKNIIKPGKPEAALMSAGSGGNARNVKSLDQLGEFTGTPMLEEAQILAAMRTFGNAKYLPVDTTGKSLTRMGVGTAGGFLLGGPVGAAVGAASTSPATLKGAIDLGNLASKGLSKLPDVPMKQQLYQSLIQKSLEKQNEQSKPAIDTDAIMQKVKGSKYEGVLNNSIKAGGNSFAAANYVLKNRDENYRKLFEKNK